MYPHFSAQSVILSSTIYGHFLRNEVEYPSLMGFNRPLITMTIGLSQAMQTHFQDDQIIIRPCVMGDLEDLYMAVTESLADLMPYLPWAHENYSRRDSLQWLSYSEESWERKRDFDFAIISKKDNQLLGGIGINEIFRMDRMANLGYWVRSSAVGGGVASRACRLAALFAFQELGMQRIEIKTLENNIASQKVAEKLGANKEGLARNRLFVFGKPNDAMVYSIIPNDLSRMMTLEF